MVMKNGLILLFLAFCSITSAQIINFPDPNFKWVLVNSKCVDINGDSKGDIDADFNNDGEIDVDEALQLDSLFLYRKGIENLGGIENFKNLTYLDCGFNWLNSLDVSKLQNLKYLDCNKNQLTTLDVSKLSNLLFLDCTYNQLTSLIVSGLNNLISLDCKSNKLSSLDVSGLHSLSSLDCYFNQLTSLDVSGLNNLTTLVCNANHITSLLCSELNMLSYLDCSGNELTSLDVSGLNNLLYFNCEINKMHSLDVSRMKYLSYLSCENNKLTTLNVSELNDLIDISCYNNELTSLFIKGSKKLHPVDIRGNKNLIYICCNEDQIPNMKINVLAKGLINCEVNSYCSFNPSGKYYILQGNFTYDGNNDSCDEQDIKLPNLKYNITNGNTDGTLISNSTGKYRLPIQEGTHNIQPIIEHSDIFESIPPSFTFTFPNQSDTITQNFCITSKGFFSKTDITIIPLSPPARPGFDTSYKIVWENVGNQIESGTLNFTYDELLMDYISAAQTPEQITNGIIKWSLTNLLPFEKREITVTLKVNRPTETPAVNAGDKLYLTASILDNIFTLENTVVGSYDPNDKTCLQGDRVKPDMVGEYVDYLIRFENTGNYAAENVVVKDIIDTKRFDVSTLQITDASHEVYTRIEGNKVEFIFEKIQLPFDDANNDGYIAFKIKTLPTLVLGDSLKNMADIYFDYNYPIRTNEAKTTIALSVSTADIATDIIIYPNPVRDILFLQTDEIWTKAEIYDISGRIMRSVTLHGTSVDVSSLERGTYIIKLRNGDKYGNVKFVKM
jgi:hypothetical protein